MDRPIVSVYVAVSLDGRIARADGARDWLAPMDIEGEDYGFSAFLAKVDSIVLGRSTYETALGFDPWPYPGRRVVVLTHRPLAASHGETTHRGALAPLLSSLGAGGARHVYVDGGQAIRQALSEDLVDQLTLSFIPIVLGDGRGLFAAGLPESRWTLQATRGFSTGLVQCRYRCERNRARVVAAPEHGALSDR